MNFRSWAGCKSTTWISTLATVVIHALHKWKPAGSALLLAESRKEWLELITQVGNDILHLDQLPGAAAGPGTTFGAVTELSMTRAQDWGGQDEVNNQIPYEAPVELDTYDRSADHGFYSLWASVSSPVNRINYAWLWGLNKNNISYSQRSTHTVSHSAFSLLDLFLVIFPNLHNDLIDLINKQYSIPLCEGTLFNWSHMNNPSVWFRSVIGGVQNAPITGIVKAPGILWSSLSGLQWGVTQIDVNLVNWPKPYISQVEVNEREI